MINQSEPMAETNPNCITIDTIKEAIKFLKASESDQDRLMRHLYDIEEKYLSIERDYSFTPIFTGRYLPRWVRCGNCRHYDFGLCYRFSYLYGSDIFVKENFTVGECFRRK